jgi:hypothetical protein
MRNGLLWVLGAWVFSLGQLGAQAPPIIPSEGEPPLLATDPVIAPLSWTADNGRPNRVWARADYLLWWVKDAPLPVPIVTTGDPNVGFDPKLVNTVNTAGAIGQPGTQVLLGDSGIRFPASSGLRVAIGGWVDEGQHFGIEGSGFLLQRSSNTFSAASNSAGNPPLYFPIFSGIAGAERAIPIADPLRGFSGNVDVTSTLQLWGAELNAMFPFYRQLGLELTLLAGFRYAELRESLSIHNTTTDLMFGNVTILNDSFDTRNQFYGGQIGGRLAFQLERFSLDVTGKVALGLTHQLVDIEGNITQAGPNPLVPPGLGTFPGGLFAQTSNIGQRPTDQFTVPFTALSSLELKLAYAITPHIRAFVGYEILYWTGVVRPGDQIDHNVNLSQNAVLDPKGVGTLVGPAQPAPLFNRSDFWAQGFNLGVEFRY